GEHALEMIHTAGAEFLVRVYDDLGIASRREAMSAVFQTTAQAVMVVDLAVEDDPDVAGLIGHRLRAADAIDDREAPMPERRIVRFEIPLAIGPAVLQCSGHRTNRGPHVRCERPAR